jgi:hypothetical protein
MRYLESFGTYQENVWVRYLGELWVSLGLVRVVEKGFGVVAGEGVGLVPDDSVIPEQSVSVITGGEWVR